MSPLERAAAEYSRAIADGRLVIVDDDTPFSSDLEGKVIESIIIDEHPSAVWDDIIGPPRPAAKETAAMNFAGRKTK